MKNFRLLTATLIFILVGVSALIFALEKQDLALAGDVHEPACIHSGTCTIGGS